MAARPPLAGASSRLLASPPGQRCSGPRSSAGAAGRAASARAARGPCKRWAAKGPLSLGERRGWERLSFTTRSPALPPIPKPCNVNLIALEREEGCFPKVKPTWKPRDMSCLFSQVPKKFPTFSIVSFVNLPHFTDLSVAVSGFIFNTLLITFSQVSWSGPVPLTEICTLPEGRGARQKLGCQRPDGNADVSLEWRGTTSAFNRSPGDTDVHGNLITNCLHSGQIMSL